MSGSCRSLLVSIGTTCKGPLLSHPAPVLVNAVVSPMELAMPPKVTAQMARGFTLYMIKAVLNGPRGRGHRARAVEPLALTWKVRGSGRREAAPE